MREIRAQIHLLGHEVISSWLDEDQSFNSIPEMAPGFSFRDLGEVMASDLLIIDTFEGSNTGGREVEYGAAIALGRPVWRVGPSRNIFHSIAKRTFNSWEAVYYDLSRVQ